MTGDPDPGEVKDPGEFYGKYETAAYAFALAMLKNHHDAEDSVSDSFLTVTQYWERVRFSPGSTRTYLFVVLRNQIKARLRTRSAQRETLWDPTDAEAFVSSIVDDFAQQTADYSTLMSALSQLPEEQREAVVLFHFLDKSTSEIATAMGGINRNTAKERVRAGRKRLYQILTESADTRKEDPR